MELGHFDKQSSAKREKKASQGKIPAFFSCKVLKIAFYPRNLTHR